jgi:hypothetical protein
VRFDYRRNYSFPADGHSSRMTLRLDSSVEMAM